MNGSYVEVMRDIVMYSFGEIIGEMVAILDGEGRTTVIATNLRFCGG